MKKFKLIVAMTLTAALMLTGCGGGGNTSSSSSASTEASSSQTPSSQEESSSAEEIDESKLEVMKTADTVNVRETPSTDGKIVTKLAKGTEVKVIKNEGEWTRVYVDKKVCYISSQFLKDKNAKEEESSAAKPEEGSYSGNKTGNQGSGRIVCIDAGHQAKGNSSKEPIGPGASETKAKVSGGTTGVATGKPEYQLTLEVALQLQTELTNRGYTVIMCRTSNNVDISNAERAQIANNAGASAFIRLHANGSTNQSTNGALTMCQRGDNPFNGNLAGQSLALSKAVVNNLCAATGARNCGVSQVNNMSGINWAKVPVTIVEMGYMSNPTEDRNMSNSAYQNKIVVGIANGIDEFLKK